MSQAGSTSQSTGPVPPGVATSYITDFRDNSTVAGGTAIPAGGVLQILSRQTDQNDDNGCRTDADPNNGNIIYAELTNRLTGTTTTTDDTLTTTVTLPLGTTPGVFYVWGNAQAYAYDVPVSAGTYSFSGGFRTDGATAVVLGTEFHDDFEDPVLVTAEVFFNVAANDVLLQVQGVLATNIRWNTMIEFRQVN